MERYEMTSVLLKGQDAVILSRSIYQVHKPSDLYPYVQYATLAGLVVVPPPRWGFVGLETDDGFAPLYGT